MLNKLYFNIWEAILFFPNIICCAGFLVSNSNSFVRFPSCIRFQSLLFIGIYHIIRIFPSCPGQHLSRNHADGITLLLPRKDQKSSQVLFLLACRSDSRNRKFPKVPHLFLQLFHRLLDYFLLNPQLCSKKNIKTQRP